jgi:hypothetical protein
LKAKIPIRHAQQNFNYPKDSGAIDPKEIVEALFDILIWNPKEGAHVVVRI